MMRKFSLFGIFILLTSLFFIQIPSVSSVAACSCIGIESGDGNPPQICGPSTTCGSDQLVDMCGGINPDYTCGGECYCASPTSTCFATESACQATLTLLGCAASGRSNLNWCFLYSANCWKTTVKGCQFGACPADVCSGVVTWSDYPLTGSYSCSGVGDGSENGLCSTSPITNGQCNAVSSTCTTTKANTCVQEGCGGSLTTCHYTNAGTGAVQWDRILTPETACTDGKDNDCDTKIDCVAGNEDPDCGCLGNPTAPKLKFRDGAGPSNVAVIGSNGVMDIRGTLSPSQASISSSTADFVIKNNAGTIVAMIEKSTGNLFLKGAYDKTKSQPQMNAYLANAQTEFIVKTAAGNVVAVFDINGNLFMLTTGGLRINQPNPQ